MVNFRIYLFYGPAMLGHEATISKKEKIGIFIFSQATLTYERLIKTRLSSSFKNLHV